jgi:homoserine kinase
VSNVACGFDVLGFALDHPGDEVTARFLSGNAHGVLIESIDGDNGRLPRDAARNTAGVAALALLTKLGERRGVGLSIRKGCRCRAGRRQRRERRCRGRCRRRPDRRRVDY